MKVYMERKDGCSEDTQKFTTLFCLRKNAIMLDCN